MRLAFLITLAFCLNVFGQTANVGQVNGNLTAFGSHSVFWTHDGFYAATNGQVDLQWTNCMSLSYGSKWDTNSLSQISQAPATNSFGTADPVFDFACDYTGTNMQIYSGANANVNWYHYVIDGDDNAPYSQETNIGSGWIHFQFTNNVTHAIRLRINGKQFHGNTVRVMGGDTCVPSAESKHRVTIIMFGDSHIDGNTTAGEMDTLVNRGHTYFLKTNILGGSTVVNRPYDPVSLFGSGIGGSGFINPGQFVPYTNRFYNDIFLQQAIPQMLFFQSANDHSLMVDAASSNALAKAVQSICLSISTNMTAGNVWLCYGPQPCGSGQIDTGSIWCRDMLKTNCTFYGFNFIDFLGGATNTSDINRGFVTDSNFSTMWSGGHLTTPVGKEWFSQYIATNFNPIISALFQ